MAYIGPPVPLTLEQFVAAGCRDPEFEAWKRDCARQSTAAVVALLVSVGLLLAVGIGAAVHQVLAGGGW